MRRIRRLLPQAKILVGLWLAPPGDPDYVLIKDNSGADLLATSLGEATELCLNQLQAVAKPADMHSPAKAQLKVHAVAPAIASTQDVTPLAQGA